MRSERADHGRSLQHRGRRELGGSNLWGQNVWDILLQGGELSGVLAEPSQTDGLYETGFSRLQGTGVPFPSFGAYPGYSVALNTAYAQGALYGNAYRDLPITSSWVNVGDQSGDPAQINQFNDVTFHSVTTTKLRISMQGTGTASVGVVQWVVPSIPS